MHAAITSFARSIPTVVSSFMTSPFGFRLTTQNLNLGTRCRATSVSLRNGEVPSIRKTRNRDGKFSSNGDPTKKNVASRSACGPLRGSTSRHELFLVPPQLEASFALHNGSDLASFSNRIDPNLSVRLQ